MNPGSIRVCSRERHGSQLRPPGRWRWRARRDAQPLDQHGSAHVERNVDWVSDLRQ